MKITIKGLDSLTRRQAEEILRRIFDTCDGGFIKFQLGIRKIEGRTRVYQAFQQLYYYNKNVLKLDTEDWLAARPEQEQDKIESIKRVLDQTSISEWVYSYSKIVTLKRIIQIVAPSMNNKIEIVAELEGQRTN